MKKLDLGIKKYDLGIMQNNTFNSHTDFKSLGLFNDTDKDGRINILDCDPLNPKKQHAYPSIWTRRRLKKLPVYVVLEDGRRVHVLSREARQKERKTVETFLSAIKKQPESLGEIERNPHIINLTPEKEENLLGEAYKTTKGKDEVFVYSHEREKQKLTWEGKIKRVMDLYGVDREGAKKYLDEHKYRRGISKSDEYASTIRHETEHVKQYGIERELEKTNPSAHTRYKKGFEGEYTQRVREREARKTERKMITKRKRMGYGSRKYATRNLVRTLDEDDSHVRDQDMGLV